MSLPENSMFANHVALDHALLVPRQEEVVSAEFPTKKPFPLLKLPPELRAMVYEPLIEAGDLSVVRVSKLVSQEAVPLLSKVARLRISLGHPNLSPVTLDLTASITLSGRLTLIAPDYIQHLEFHLNMPMIPLFPVDTKLIYCFSGNRIARKSCKITINLGTYRHIPRQLEENETYRVIAALTGFKLLTLKLENQRDAEQDPYMLGRYCRLPMRFENNVMHSVLLEGYEQILGFLTVTLGPAKFNKSVDGHSLEFWPRKYEAEDGL